MSLIQPDRFLFTAPTEYQEVFIGRGDRLRFESVVASVRPLKLRIKDNAGVAQNITSGTLTVVDLRDSSAKITSQTLTVDDAASGEISYMFNASIESDEPGPFLAELTLVVNATTYRLAERIAIHFYNGPSRTRLHAESFLSTIGSQTPLKLKIKNEKGAAQNVTAATLSLKNTRDGASKFTGASFTIDSAIDGEISFTFNAATQSDEPGTFYGQVTPTIGGIVQPIVQNILCKFGVAL